MRKKLIIEYISKKYSIEKNMVEKAVQIIEDNSILNLNNVSLSTILISTLKIKTSYAASITYAYDRLSKMTDKEINDEIYNIKVSSKNRKNRLIYLITFLLILVIIILIASVLAL